MNWRRLRFFDIFSGRILPHRGCPRKRGRSIGELGNLLSVVLPDETRAALESYADGVNQYINNRGASRISLRSYGKSLSSEVTLSIR